MLEVHNRAAGKGKTGLVLLQVVALQLINLQDSGPTSGQSVYFVLAVSNERSARGSAGEGRTIGRRVSPRNLPPMIRPTARLGLIHKRKCAEARLGTGRGLMIGSHDKRGTQWVCWSGAQRDKDPPKESQGRGTYHCRVKQTVSTSIQSQSEPHSSP